MNPRHSLRKVFGVYEHELNHWLEKALRRVNRVLDVGANDGYFTFGSAAAFRRLRKSAQIVCFEPQSELVHVLRESAVLQASDSIRIEIMEVFVGHEVSNGMTTLDALPITDRRNTLLKIDVEGAELDVVKGARLWMDDSNLYVVEVHRYELLAELRQLFAECGHELQQLDQKRLPFLGGESRDEQNWWLVSKLGAIDG